jgi:hypothetical protein
LVTTLSTASGELILASSIPTKACHARAQILTLRVRKIVANRKPTNWDWVDFEVFRNLTPFLQLQAGPSATGAAAVGLICAATDSVYRIFAVNAAEILSCISAVVSY